MNIKTSRAAAKWIRRLSFKRAKADLSRFVHHTVDEHLNKPNVVINALFTPPDSIGDGLGMQGWPHPASFRGRGSRVRLLGRRPARADGGVGQEDRTFDVIYAISVLTHIAWLGDAWLKCSTVNGGG